ncbi:MAG: RecQ family ATP-dependent DNA helicase [Bacteroidales bacterium]|nr:RecQ family ATP-dependent DNA helicase [Bacteroidales bacterium]
MSQFHKILKKYWGYDSFRPLQLDIIESVASGVDTLALLPTGGGKSITFQVPAMAKDGLCLVITPLIALMKDQVENLKKRNIKAMAIYSGMSMSEISTAFDNCIYGDYKFLYLSPERLQTQLFTDRLQNLPVNLVAIDEAHCISQWGFDFRPSYLQIHKIREILPDVPFLALTASARPEVQDDICKYLELKSANIIRKSFFRDNLVYVVRETNDKIGQLVKICNSVKGTGIVYVSTRRRTKEVAEMLRSKRISADYYHGGLTNEVRSQKQESWQRGYTRVVVATNAFGMGIDKADVRFVVHLNLPDSMEAYYQEAGRGGRDEKKAFAALLYNKADVTNINKRVAEMFPEIEVIKRVYSAVCNYLNIPYGSGKGMSFDFNIKEFSDNFKFELLTAFHSLKYLQKEGYLILSDEISNPSKVHFLIARDALYNFQIRNNNFDAFIKLLLRTYEGMFSVYVGIDENKLAKIAKVSVDVIYNYLSRLDKLGVIHYIPPRKGPQIVFNIERLKPEYLFISQSDYKIRLEAEQNRVNGVLNYATRNYCRSKSILEYFCEENATNCGKCDFCLRKENISFKELEQQVLTLLHNQSLSLDIVVSKLKVSKSETISVLDYLVDEGVIRRLTDGLYSMTDNVVE